MSFSLVSMKDLQRGQKGAKPDVETTLRLNKHMNSKHEAEHAQVMGLVSDAWTEREEMY